LAESADKCSSIDREVDRRLLRIAAEPLRFKALLRLNERTGGASELAEDLEMSVSDAKRHLEQMEKDGLVEVVGQVLGRDAFEPRYRAGLRLLWNDEEWAELGEAERRRLTAWTMQMIGSDVCEALEAGTFGMRFDTHITHNVFRVDEQGWRELSRIFDEALEAIFAVEAASAGRLVESGEEGVPVLSALICGELPPQSGPS
jgi:DNA-binding transcriptional ArsR family regulator